MSRENSQAVLEQKIANLIEHLRPGQKELALWQGGKMAVSAVPGAGKSHSLAIAAAVTIAREKLNAERQLVIVTYTRSAAASIKQKVQAKLEELQLPPVGFTVQTIHGLALNIANAHPYLSELNLDSSTLIEPNRNHRIIRETVENWVQLEPDYYDLLVKGCKNFDYEESEVLRRQSVLVSEVLPSVAHHIIRICKSSRLHYQTLKDFSLSNQDLYPLMAIASGLYQQYEQIMKAQNLIDYDDLILGALKVLENEAIRKKWQTEVFAVFEDEAQDSSLLQGELLELLASQEGQDEANLVRVGDPNQAINSTFTAADPIYFQYFCQYCQEQEQLQEMKQAGRSSPIIIDKANQVLGWVNDDLQNNSDGLITLPFKRQMIEPTQSGDMQADANPPAEGKGVELYAPEDIYQTIELIGNRIVELHEQQSQATFAVLVRENRQGIFVYQHLEHLQLDEKINLKLVNDLHNYSYIPQQILSILQFLHAPHSSQNLHNALQTLQDKDLIEAQDINALSIYPEKFLYPNILEKNQPEHEQIARDYCIKMLNARLELPEYQLIPFLCLTLKYQQSELATAQKLSERIQQNINGRYSLEKMIASVQEIINNEKFEAIDTESEDSYTQPGQVTIMTMHKAKGLEWDYVFLPFLHEDVLPGEAKPYVPKSSLFLGDFNLADVLRTQIRHILHEQYRGNHQPPLMSIPSAWTKFYQNKQAEEYRLLYVAMTRAKRLLWMSSAKKAPWRWNFFTDYANKSKLTSKKKPCPVMDMLYSSDRLSLTKS